MHVLFTWLNYISVLAVLVCTVLICTHQASRMQKIASIQSFMMLFCCIGYLWKQEAQTIGGILAGYKLCYGTVTHAMFLMLLFLLAYCEFKIPKWMHVFCHGVNLLMSAVVFTMDYHSLFYKTCWLEMGADGYFVLEKEYGIFHTLIIGLFAVYMLLAIAITVEFTVRNMKKKGRYARRLLLAVAIPCLSYLIPKILHLDNDFQPLAFAAFMILVVGMVYRYNLYDVDNLLMQYSVESVEDLILVFDASYGFKGCNEKAKALFPVLSTLGLDTDIRSESELIADFLDEKYEEYTLNDKIYSVGIRKVGGNGSGGGKVLWLRDVTMERNYNRLLLKEKLFLESEVVTLSDISSKDQMTGLFNRRSYEMEIEKIRQAGDISGITVFALDINGLKKVNDTLGHVAGDELICAAADIIREVFSESGKCFRTGGDEFFVISDKPMDIELFMGRFHGLCGKWSGTLVKSLSVSCGPARGSDHPGMTVDALMILADKKMYEAKDVYYSKQSRRE